MEMIVLSISNDYTKTPGARTKEQGDFSGEDFRETKLIPAFKKATDEHRKLLVDLDGCYGFLLSFLDEAFGGLTLEFGKSVVKETLDIKSEDERSLIDAVNTSVEEWEEKRLAGGNHNEKM